MKKDYCLLDEPWLPVRQTDGRVVEMGLLEVFERSGEIVALAETAPPSLVAQYRLLLAITHRALTQAFGSWKDKDRARWYREGLPLPEIRAYLERWRERFWLFHPEFPFMQVAALATAKETCDKRKPWTQIALASANGNTPVVFDHAYDVEPTPISPAQAVSTLLGFLQFTPGGLVRVLRDRDEGGSLDNTAATIPTGGTLSQTLCLCLHPAPSGHGDEDLPSWESQALTILDISGGPVLATGQNDRYTRVSRAVLFEREDDGRIRWIKFAVGRTLGKDPHAPDSMASFRTGKNGPVKLTFVGGRSLWRDLPALVPNPLKDSQPAAVIDYAISLHQLSSFGAVYQPILIAGVAGEVMKMKVLRWRIEQITLPTALLANVQAALHLRRLVSIADALFSDLRSLAITMLAHTMPEPTKRETMDLAGKIFKSCSFGPNYFASAERALPEAMRLIGEENYDDAEVLWSTTLREAAQGAWDQLLAGLGGSPRALKADAKFWPRFHGLLNKLVPKQESLTVKEA